MAGRFFDWIGDWIGKLFTYLFIGFLVLGLVNYLFGGIIRIIWGMLTEPWGDHGEDD